MIFKHRSVVDSIPAYKQGKPAPEVANRRSFKLSSNENPYPPLPSVQKAVEEHALDCINRYPDMGGWRVVERLAKDYMVEPENVVLGCGSTEVITQLVNLLAGPGDEVVYPWRSFEAYPIIVSGSGATSVQIPNRPDGGHDFDAMIAAINDKTRMIVVNNPNNPTSVSVRDDEARRLMEAVPSDVIVLFDEAYVHFNTDPQTSVAMQLYREYPNIVIAHTFSKAYGLAGLRIGFGIGPSEVITGMRKLSLPFGVTQSAQVAALASLEADAELQERVQSLIEERDRIVAALDAQGWQFPTPYANFFWLPLGAKTADAAARFTDEGLSVRVFEGEGIRISIGEVEANTKVIETCKKLRYDGIV